MEHGIILEQWPVKHQVSKKKKEKKKVMIKKRTEVDTMSTKKHENA